MPLDLAVIGLGYVGLPLAREAVRAGLQVRGFDVTTPVVDALNEGRSHVDDISDADVASMVEAGFRATADVEDIRGAAAVVICVPTPLGQDGGPDLGAVIAATRTVAGVLEPGMVVVLESTTYPGTTEEVLKPILEEGGLRCGEDFHLAFSPERIDPGNPTYGMKNTPKVVGGLTPEATERAAALYSRFVDTVVVAKGAREAETAKLLENTYRHINIALVNEMARFCHELGIDLWDVIRLAKTKPFGFQAFYPGPGVGGHCIPIDPNYLSHNVRSRLGYPFRFVELAQEINATMPSYVVRRAQDILNEDAKAMRGSRVLVLGVTYKPDIADQRESPAVAVARALVAQGAELVFHDPHVARWHVNGEVLDRVADLDTAILEADLVILVQNHSAYDVDVLAEKSVRFFDTKGATTHPDAIRL
ncbi:nucleotide sugar dehydrogenase [Isoptericola sp. NPDC056578]|uniref:nucleotide sugar dehydrogenase n=1 Tax=Isoptericola sp. NPDC056578 TaxID=3345870 RepID=UPI00369CAFD6